MRLITLLVVTTMCLACTVTSPMKPSDAVDFCASEINRHRAAIGLPALSTSPELQAFAAESARIDGAARQAHQHFTQTDGGGVAFAETELLMWSGDVQTVIQQGLNGMWNQGPGGEHYQILTGPYQLIGCGVFADHSGVTVVQDFR